MDHEKREYKMPASCKNVVMEKNRGNQLDGTQSN